MKVLEVLSTCSSNASLTSQGDFSFLDQHLQGGSRGHSRFTKESSLAKHGSFE